MNEGPMEFQLFDTQGIHTQPISPASGNKQHVIGFIGSKNQQITLLILPSLVIAKNRYLLSRPGIPDFAKPILPGINAHLFYFTIYNC